MYRAAPGYLWTLTCGLLVAAPAQFNVHDYGAKGDGAKDPAGLDLPELVDRYPEATMWSPLPAWAFYSRHVDGLTLRNITARWTTEDRRSAMIIHDVHDLTLDGFQPSTSVGATPALWLNVGATPALWLNNVSGALIRGSRPTAFEVFLRVSGQDSRRIVLTGNDLSQARHAFEIQSAPPDAVTDIANAKSGR